MSLRRIRRLVGVARHQAKVTSLPSFKRILDEHEPQLALIRPDARTSLGNGWCWQHLSIGAPMWPPVSSPRAGRLQWGEFSRLCAMNSPDLGPTVGRVHDTSVNLVLRQPKVFAPGHHERETYANSDCPGLVVCGHDLSSTSSLLRPMARRDGKHGRNPARPGTHVLVYSGMNGCGAMLPTLTVSTPTTADNRTSTATGISSSIAPCQIPPRNTLTESIRNRSDNRAKARLTTLSETRRRQGQPQRGFIKTCHTEYRIKCSHILPHVLQR
jgi:hypothetical protein